MKTTGNNKKNTTAEITLRKWCMEQAVKLAAIPRKREGAIQYNIAILDEEQLFAQAQKLYDWIKAIR